MRLRWPLMLRRTHDAAIKRQREVLWVSEGYRMTAQDREIARLRDELARLESAAYPAIRVAPFWLGLPNEVLTLIVTTNMDGLQATLSCGARDDESDDPRRNPRLPFGLKPTC